MADQDQSAIVNSVKVNRDGNFLNIEFVMTGTFARLANRFANELCAGSIDHLIIPHVKTALGLTPDDDVSILYPDEDDVVLLSLEGQSLTLKGKTEGMIR